MDPPPQASHICHTEFACDNKYIQLCLVMMMMNSVVDLLLCRVEHLIGTNATQKNTYARMSRLIRERKPQPNECESGSTCPDVDRICVLRCVASNSIPSVVCVRCRLGCCASRLAHERTLLRHAYCERSARKAVNPMKG